MVIIILGAGQVGSMLAENLSAANHLTIVDTEPAKLRNLQDRLDIRTVEGFAAFPSVLARAGARDADLLIAVTNSDETNMVACQIAQSLFHIPTKIARIRAQDYILQKEKLFNADTFPVDVLISPESLVTDHIQSLVNHPGATQVIGFAGGELQLVAVPVSDKSELVGKDAAYLATRLPDVELRLMGIFRGQLPISPQGDAILASGDDLFIMARRKDIPQLMSLSGNQHRPYRKIIIAGGGNIGSRVAKALECHFHVKVIEQCEERCRQLARQLKKAVVLKGQASDKALLLEKSIDETDLFISLTNDDEDNVMAAMLAKQLGAREVITLINNPAYVDLVQGGVIDIAVSPQHVTIGALLTYIRKGDVASVHALRRGAAEILEIVAHGDKSNSKVVGRAIGELALPPDAIVGAILRGQQILIARDTSIIEDGDHVVIMLLDKQDIVKVERLFQVGFSFF